MELSPFDLPLFAMQRTDNGRWLVRAPSAGDPLRPAAITVASIDDPVWRPRPRRMLGIVPRLDVCGGTEAVLLPEWYLD